MQVSKRKKGEIIDFASYTKNKKKWDSIFSVNIYRDDKSDTYAYSTNKSKKCDVKDEFLAYSLTLIIQDILEYSGSPEEILELTQQLEEMLGFTPDE